MLLGQDTGRRTRPEPPKKSIGLLTVSPVMRQTLKERFAELLPEKIEQIKTLRK